MPFVLLIIGVACIVVGVRNTQGMLFALLKQDVTGQGSFVPWMLAIFVIGGSGYIKPIRPITTAFLVLVIIVLFLSNGGFFQKFTNAFGIGSLGSASGGMSSSLQTSSPAQNVSTGNFAGLTPLQPLSGSQQ